ncbi:hypothetical protein [Actinomadura nitritigenes]|uniref:hypothetical protein n=1 Tax=Actinomadura nitritigenes TaxID=134602 RepID=UPI003D8E1576
MSERRKARAALPASTLEQRQELVDELVMTAPVAGWQHRLGDRGAARSYERLQELAGVLGFSAPPPVERLADTGERSTLDEWYRACGID